MYFMLAVLVVRMGDYEVEIGRVVVYSLGMESADSQ